MARLRNYYNGIVEDGASITRFGTGVSPCQEVTVDGSPNGSPKQLTVAAGSTVVLWCYSAADPEWEMFHGRIVTDDAVGVLSWLVAEPTSASDLTPLLDASGPTWRWRHMDVQAFCPFFLGSDQAYMSDDDNIATNDGGNVTASGYATTAQALLDGAAPKLWDATHTPIQGRIYKLVVRNPGDEDFVVEFGRVN